jgi:hypothetical protein
MEEEETTLSKKYATALFGLVLNERRVDAVKNIDSYMAAALQDADSDFLYQLRMWSGFGPFELFKHVDKHIFRVTDPSMLHDCLVYTKMWFTDFSPIGVDKDSLLHLAVKQNNIKIVAYILAQDEEYVTAGVSEIMTKRNLQGLTALQVLLAQTPLNKEMVELFMRRLIPDHSHKVYLLGSADDAVFHRMDDRESKRNKKECPRF